MIVRHIAVIVALVSALLLGCSTGGGLANVLGYSVEAPVYKGHTAVSDRQVDFHFSTEVSVECVSLSRAVALEETRQGKTVSLIFGEGERLLPGEKLTADMLVRDAGGNTLEVSAPFRARNDRVPRFVINEVRLARDKPKKGPPRVEFIEFKMLSAGNMGAVKVYVASVMGKLRKAGLEDALYEFAPREVESGEYVPLYLRPQDGDALSIGNLPGIRRAIQKTDAIYAATQNDDIIDGLVIAENEEKWNKSTVGATAELLAEAGKWPSAEFAAAVPTKGSTAVKTLCRDESADNSQSPDNWYRARYTPGALNNSKASTITKVKSVKKPSKARKAKKLSKAKKSKSKSSKRRANAKKSSAA
jgi:hypothetical protein